MIGRALPRSALALLALGCSGEGEAAPDAEAPPWGLDERPVSASCVARTAEEAPALLSATGCVDPAAPGVFAPGLVPYAVNVPQWADGADGARAFAVPSGATLAAAADGDLELPNGSVVLKTMELAGRRVETQVLARGADGRWSAYAYAWNEAQTDAELVETPRSVQLPGGNEYLLLGRDECLRCHTSASGVTLGLEAGQLNRTFDYPGERRANQLATLEHVGLLAAPLTEAQATPLPPTRGSDTAERRARAYLHANCAFCHRAAPAALDLRFGTPFAQTGACNAPAQGSTLGVKGATILVPGDPSKSLLTLRMRSTVQLRMPPLGTRFADQAAIEAIEAWIRGLPGCP